MIGGDSTPGVGLSRTTLRQASPSGCPLAFSSAGGSIPLLPGFGSPGRREAGFGHSGGKGLGHRRP